MASIGFAAADAPKPEMPNVFCPDDRRFRDAFHSVTLPPSADSSADSSDEYIMIAVDVETTGQRLIGDSTCKAHAMVELGAAAFSSHNSNTPIGVFEGFMPVPDDREWDAKTVSEFWGKTERGRETMERIALLKTDIGTTMSEFVAWALRVVEKFAAGDGKRVIFYSDNPGYDIAWINAYIQTYTVNKDMTMQTFFGGWAPIIDTDSFAVGKSDAKSHAHAIAQTAGSWFSPNEAAEACIAGAPSAYRQFEGFTEHRASHDAIEIYRRHAWLQRMFP